MKKPLGKRKISESSYTLDFYFKKRREKDFVNDGLKKKNLESNLEEKNKLIETELKTESNLSVDEKYARELQAIFDAEHKESLLLNSKSVLNNSLKKNNLLEKSSIKNKTNIVGKTLDQVKPIIEKTPVQVKPVINKEILFGNDIDNFFPEKYQDDFSEIQPVPYQILVQLFCILNSTKSRIKIINALTNYIRTLLYCDQGSLLPSIWLSVNGLGPSFKKLDLNIGESIIYKAILNLSGLRSSELRKIFHRYGDIGDVAFNTCNKIKTIIPPKILTVRDVYLIFQKIAELKGYGSQECKQKLIEELLIRARGEEIRYVTRTLVLNLRIGSVKSTMLTALARAFSLTLHPTASWTLEKLPENKEQRQTVFQQAESILKKCYAKYPDYGKILEGLLCGGVKSLETFCPLTLHIPIRPMLGSITKDLSELFIRINNEQIEFACEYKYDGQRAQLHCGEDGKISIFSRNLDLMTDKYPDIVELIPKVKNNDVTSFIIEGEIVAINQESGKLESFQTLSNRGRKAVSSVNIRINVCFFVFDIMFLNGKELISHSFRQRRELLRSSFSQIENKFCFVKNIDATTSEYEKVIEFYHNAVNDRCEGLMVKTLDNIDSTSNILLNKGFTSKRNNNRKPFLATYEPDKRLESWLKVKKDYHSGADSLDLVPIGGWHGMGRKASWWSPILLAVRDSETGVYHAVCKCISGFTDSFYAEIREKYSEENGNIFKETKDKIDSPLVPDFWWNPQEVWEIKFGDITVSPVYTAAADLISSNDKGLSIRFPRFVRKREDKSIEDASTPLFLAQLYEQQEKREAFAIEPKTVSEKSSANLFLDTDSD